MDRFLYSQGYAMHQSLQFNVESADVTHLNNQIEIVHIELDFS